VNVSQLNAVNATAGAGWNVSAQGANATNVGPNSATGSTVDLKNTDGNIVVSKSSTSNNVTFNLANNVNVAGSVTVGPAASGTSITSTGVTTNGGSGPSLTITGINAANTVITNVAKGQVSATSTDAVNGSQLYATNQTINNLVSSVANGGVGPVQYSNPSSPTTPNGGKPSQDLTLVGAATGPVTLHNVAPGVAQTDAVNVGQLGSAVAGLGGGASINPSTGAVTGPTYTVSNANGTTSTVNNVGAALDAINSTGIKYFHANSTAPDSQALGMDSVAIGPKAISNYAGDIALGAGSVTAATVATPSATINGTLYTFAGGAPISTVSVGAPGAERTITNVAAGRINASSTDAINGSQLNAADQAIAALSSKVNSLGSTVANNLGGGSSYNTSTGAVTSPTYGNVGNGSGGLGNNVGGGTGPAANVSSGLQAAANTWITGNPTTYTPPLATGANSTAAGSGAVSTGNNSVALGGNSSDSGRANVVSVGAAGAERQITNVAAGTQSTDAVNLSQLNSAIGQSNANVTQQLNGLQQNVNNVARNAYAGVAAATALTMIPDVDKDKTLSLGIGSGFYHGYQAVAVGGTARVTENIKVRAGVSTSPGNGTTFGMGASMQW
ncbi:YadA-like family protein, partial [Ralstonia insidiosa]|jgi:autotransporter adhesin|uniref:YadA family autotransporter adhesin n=3 Tax=Burkholderiaceae TaxID=119060 RepID=UPI00200AE5BE